MTRGGQSTTNAPMQSDDGTTASMPTAMERGRKPSALGLLTESRCQVARRCMREESLRYVDGIVPAVASDALRFGTLWHHGQEAWWTAKKLIVGDRFADASPLDDALLYMREQATDETDAYELARAEAMLEGYDARWGGEQFEVLAVEAEFRAPLVNPETGAASRTWERAGRVDAIVRDASRRVLIVEHKTSGDDIAPGSGFWSRLRMGGQSSGYIRGAQALGHRVEGIVYDVARKPDLRPLKATPAESRKYTKAGALYANQRETDETVDEYRERVRAAIAEAPEKYYQRGLTVRLDAQLAEADSELWLLGQMLREHHRLQLAPRNTDACQRYGSTCTYFPICAGEASADDPRLFKRLEWAHPELTAFHERGVDHGK